MKTKANQSQPKLPTENLGIPSAPEAKRAWVKFQLELIDCSLAKIARENKCSPTAVQKALRIGGPLERVIAQKLGLTPQSIWPERYDEHGIRLKQRGRSLTRH